MANSTASSHLGPFLISTTVSAILYGCALVQTHVYYKLFSKDNKKLKVLVAFEMAFQTVHLAFLLLGVWQRVMVVYATTSQTLSFLNTTSVGVAFIGPVALCAQAFFVFRLRTFSHKKALPIFCSLLVMTQFVFTMMVSVFAAVDTGLSDESWNRFIISTLFITICADTTIAVSMSYYLKASKLGLDRTSRVVDRMVLYIMGEARLNSMTIVLIESPASISALASGISFLAAPDTSIWLGLIIIESGLYTNSLLSAYVLGVPPVFCFISLPIFWMDRLNARAQFSHELQHPTSADGSEPPLSTFIALDNHAPSSQSQGQTITLTAFKETAEADSESSSSGVSLHPTRPTALEV
ncbi:hypothetical protein EDC04DRAFT_2891615 [Pisolithus marmoratus]|nr:hypothetical protein EDC04DRAFT_2891615 [Pisolithus marmoratus]